MINTIIIDDERKCVSLLKHMLQQYCPNINIVATAENATEGISMINLHQPNLIFLDIEMPDKTGFELLKSLPIINFEVIFTTAYNHYAIKAIRYSALDYLMKPVDLDELKSAIARISTRELTIQNKGIELLLTNNKNGDFSKITLSTLEGLIIIHVNDIVYCEASGAYTVFYLKQSQKIIVSKSLKEYEELLKDHPFFRVHNSYLINMNEVKKYLKGDGGSVIMSNGNEVDVSKRKKELFLKLLVK